VGNDLEDGKGDAFVERVQSEGEDGAEDYDARGGGRVLVKLIGLIGEKRFAAEPMPLFLVQVNKQAEGRSKGKGEKKLDDKFGFHAASIHLNGTSAAK